VPFVEVMLRKRVPSEMRQMWTEPDALDAAVVPSGDTSMPSTRMPSLIARMGWGDSSCWEPAQTLVILSRPAVSSRWGLVGQRTVLADEVSTSANAEVGSDQPPPRPASSALVHVPARLQVCGAVH
jgi:hypothetical protein